MRKLLLALLILGVALFFPRSAHAAREFAVAYDVTYTVDEDGQTHVVQDIDLTNQTNRYYAKEYTLFISSHKVTNVAARDTIGPLEITNEDKEGGTEIHVEFNEKVVGQNQTLSWRLTYDVPDMATKNGDVWEVIIPGVSEREDVTAYDVTLYVPTSFGEPSFLSPQPVQEDRPPVEKQNRQTFSFAKDNVLKSGVTALFGKRQRYAFTITYHLKNPNVVPIFVEITLPPDTDFQSVTLRSIDPVPEDVALDSDGNTIATYQLASGQAVDVVARGTIEVFADRVRPATALTQVQEKMYTRPERYWEVDNPEIIAKAREFVRPRAIYDFVRQFLAYDYDRASKETTDRFGALYALRNPNSAVCMEFTDLFIAAARAAGIPAREVNGYAQSTDRQYRPLSLRSTTDILHAWPEYWQEGVGWTPVDPTWAATTGGIDYFENFDLNHVALAIHGTSSHLPFPAGSFKYDKSQGPDLNFSFDIEEITPMATLDLSVQFPDEFPAGFPTKATVTVRNIGNVATTAGTLTIDTETLSLLGTSTFVLGTLPAYANRVFELTFLPQGWWVNRDEEITVHLDGTSLSERVMIRPVSALFFVPWVIGIGAGLLIIFGSYGTIRFIRRRRLAAIAASPSAGEQYSTPPEAASPSAPPRRIHLQKQNDRRLRRQSR